MYTRTEYLFKFTDADQPLIHRHSDSVSFFNITGAVNFCVDLLPCHLPAIRALVRELEEIVRIQRLAELKKEDLKSELEALG